MHCEDQTKSPGSLMRTKLKNPAYNVICSPSEVHHSHELSSLCTSAIDERSCKGEMVIDI